jgi:hypothetical protein
MTHATRIAAVALLTALAVGVPVQAQTPEIDALRVRAEQGDALAQNSLGFMYASGQGVSQDYIEAHMWFNSRATGEIRERSVQGRDRAAGLMNPTQVAETHHLARERDTAHPRDP